MVEKNVGRKSTKGTHMIECANTTTTMILGVLVVEVLLAILVEMRSPAAIIRNKVSGVVLLMTAPIMGATIREIEEAVIVIIKRTEKEKAVRESISCIFSI